MLSKWQLSPRKAPPAQAEIPQIKVNQPVKVDGNVPCNETLDAVKCHPDFMRTQEIYVSWRRAAIQAEVIIRSKIKGPSDTVHSPFGTVLNFDAIINRLGLQ